MKCAHCDAVFELPKYPLNADIFMSDDGDLHYGFKCEDCGYANIAIFTHVDTIATGHT